MLKKKNARRVGLGALLATGLAALLALGGASAAFAGAGSGDDIGSGGSYGSSTWYALKTDSNSSAWAKLNRSNPSRTYGMGAEYYITQNVTPLGGISKASLINICKASDIIWFVGYDPDNGQFTGATSRNQWSVNEVFSGSAGWTTLKPIHDSTKAWLADQLNISNTATIQNLNHPIASLTIVCSEQAPDPDTFKARTWTATSDHTASYKAITDHFWLERRQISVPSSGTNALSSQDFTSETEFGSLYLAAIKPTSLANFQSQRDAIAAARTASDQGITNKFLPTGDPNRTALQDGDGGVLNMHTQVNEATVTFGYSRTVTMTQYAKCDANGNNCAWGSNPSSPSGYGTPTAGAARVVGSDPGNTSWSSAAYGDWTITKSGKTRTEKDFYQVLAVTCNVAWFRDARDAHAGTEALNTGTSWNPTGKQLLNTQVAGHTTKPAAPTGDNTVLLGARGDSTTPSSANGVEKTGYSDFYTRPCPESRWANEQVTVSGSTNWNQPYSYHTDITRQITVGGVDPIGANNLHDQAGVDGNGLATTNYAAVRDQLAGGANTSAKIYSAVDAAIAADRNFARPAIELDQNNKNGMAEGGVLNVFERTRWASISSAQTDLYYRAMAQTRIYNWDDASGWYANTWTNNVKDDGSTNLIQNARTELAEYPTSLSGSGIATPGPRSGYPCGTSVPTAPGSCVASNVINEPIVVSIPANSNEAVINGIYTAAAPSSGAGWYKKSTSYSNGEGLGTPQSTGFWQMLSVHCNPTELQAALAAYGTLGADYFVVSQTQTDSGVTTVINTKSRSSMPTANGSKLFGFTGNPVTHGALQRTGELGFYDKECSIQCTTNPAGSGSTSVNGAVSNVSNTGNLEQTDELGGAISGTTNSNYFEMFRDNEKRAITTNVAYPNVSGTVFSYNGHAPISTTAVLWKGAGIDPAARLTAPEGGAGYPNSGGTPDTSPAGGQLFVTATGGTGTGSGSSRQELFTGSVAPSTQTNFTLADASNPVNTFSGPYSTQVRGAYNTFEIGATWASLQNRPVVMNVKWEYQPTTNTTFPRTVGFQVDGTQRIVNTGAINQKIDVRCYAAYGTSTSAAPVDEWSAENQTGTGVTNEIDQTVLDSNQLNVPNADASAHRIDTNLVIKFVRGVAE